MLRRMSNVGHSRLIKTIDYFKSLF